MRTWPGQLDGHEAGWLTQHQQCQVIVQGAAVVLRAHDGVNGAQFLGVRVLRAIQQVRVDIHLNEHQGPAVSLECRTLHIWGYFRPVNMIYDVYGVEWRAMVIYGSPLAPL